jgi:hypothetical protein
MLLARGRRNTPRVPYPAIRNKDAMQGIRKQRNGISRLGRRAQDDRRTCSRFRQTMLDHKVPDISFDTHRWAHKVGYLGY